jgi:hypothetical protein
VLRIRGKDKIAIGLIADALSTIGDRAEFRSRL